MVYFIAADHGGLAGLRCRNRPDTVIICQNATFERSVDLVIKPSLPENPADITLEWMQRALTLEGSDDVSPIKQLTAQPIGEDVGLMGRLLRCHLAYDEGPSFGPRSVIVKLASSDPKSLRINRRLGLYQREHAFYCRLAANVPIRSPYLFYGDLDQSRQRFVLVLEDLSSMAAADQVQGATASQTLTAIRIIARMHGHFWNRVDRPPLSGFYDNTRPKVRPRAQLFYLANLPAMLDNFGHLFSEPMRKLAESFGVRLADYVEDLAAGPRTFTHGDFRVDNMFFGADDKDHDEFAVVDWQASGLGSGLYDVAYFMGSSVPTEIRRQMEHEALEEYYRVVLDLGAQEFSLADCWQLYRKNMLAILFVAVIAGGGLDFGNERRLRLFENSARRSLTAIEDLDAAEFLPSRRPMFSRANAFSAVSAGAYRIYKTVRM